METGLGSHAESGQGQNPSAVEKRCTETGEVAKSCVAGFVQTCTSSEAVGNHIPRHQVERLHGKDSPQSTPWDALRLRTKFCRGVQVRTLLDSNSHPQD